MVSGLREAVQEKATKKRQDLPIRRQSGKRLIHFLAMKH
jgi:hypothetical protein